MTADSLKIFAGIGPQQLASFGPQDTAGPVAVTYTAEVQTITLTGTGTAGTWALQLPGYGTAAVGLAYNIATSALATALNAAYAMTGITVTGTAGTSYVVTFPATKGNLPMQIATNGITGITAINVAETTPGAGATVATAVIPVGFSDPGWIATDGLVENVNSTTNEISGYGTTATLRVITSAESRSFDIAFMETNPTTIAIYNKVPIGTILPASHGDFSVNVGPANTLVIAGIFDVVDGLNHIRYYCPRLQVTNPKSISYAKGKEITYGVTLTALPDTNGNSIYKYYVVNALAS